MHFFFLVVIFLMACNSNQAVQQKSDPIAAAEDPAPKSNAEKPDPTSSPEEVTVWTLDKSTKILLESACPIDVCPVFSVVVDGEGIVTFQGEHNVAKFGEHTHKIPTEDVARLVKRLNEIEFSSITAKSLDESCREKREGEFAVITILAIDGDDMRTVSDDHACPGRESLRAFQKEMRDTLLLPSWMEPATTWDPEIGKQIEEEMKKK